MGFHQHLRKSLNIHRFQSRTPIPAKRVLVAQAHFNIALLLFCKSSNSLGGSQ